MDKAESKRDLGRKKGAPKGKQGAKGKTAARAKANQIAGTGKKPGRTAAPPTAETKGARVLEMIGRTEGATLAKIMAATGWQAHSVRGFISTAAKKRNVKIESAKNEAGERVYRAAK